MIKLVPLTRILWLSLVLALSIPGLKAQSLESIESQEQLNQVLTKLDAALFDSYNGCDLKKFATFFTDDVEFYHDQTGLTIGLEKLIDSLTENICGKVVRQLVPGSLQAYPMRGYGAVQMGVHRFQQPGRENIEPGGEAQFIHL